MQPPYDPRSYHRQVLQERNAHIPGRYMHYFGGLKASTGQGERLAAALAHLSILLNLFTYAGGLLVCLLLYLGSTGRRPYLVRQVVRSLVAQLSVWGLIGAGWLFYRLLPDWLGPLLFSPLGALVWFVAILLALLRAARCL